MTEEEVRNIYNREYIDKHIGAYTLSKTYNVDMYDLFHKYNLSLRNNKEKNKKYICNINYFEDINTPEKAYWLGFIFADGFIGKNNGYDRFGISISVVDKQHLYKFKEMINSTHPINTYTVSSGYKQGVEYCRIIIAEEKLVNDLIKQGCVHHKTNILQPPNIPKSLRKHWIRGYLDGDGSIIVHNTEYGDSYSIGFTGTDNILNWIMDELFDDKIINRRYPITKRKSEQIVSTFSFGGNYLVKKFLDYIYNNATIYLQRKYDRYLNLCKLIQDRENSKIKKCCDICGDNYSSTYHIWNKDDDYKGFVLCHKHYLQLYKSNKIKEDKKDYCDICGDSYGRLIHCGYKYMSYFGKTLCRKHYEQLYVYGKITDINKGWHKDDKKLYSISSS